MSYTVLARKYRPQKFADVIGQEHVTRTLKNALEQQRIAHGYIFSGHRGIGKTTIARILAMALNCKSSDRPVAEPCGVCESCREIREGSVGAMDVIEIDAATNRGIEEVRGLIATATAEPARDRYRIFILDEAHQVTDAAFNALLKTLEEPPEWVVFMMATTQPEDIPQTIRSRCQHFSFHAVKFDDITMQLRNISQAEGLTVDDGALAMLAEAGDGSMRDALSIMDQAIACCGTTLTEEVVRGLIGSVPSDVMEQVLGAVSRNSSEDVLRIVDKLLVEGQSPTHFARQMVRFLRNTLVAKVAGGESSLLQISSDEKARVERVAAMFGEEDLTRFLQIMLRTHGDVSYKQEQRFHLELGLLKMVHAQRLLPLEQLLSSAKLEAAPAPTSGSANPARSAAPSPSAHRPGSSPQPYRPSTPSTAPSRPSPFEADRSRKFTPPGSSGNKPEMSAAPSAPPFARPTASPYVPTPVSASPFPAASAPARAQAVEMGAAVAVQQAPAPAEANADWSIDAVREAVLSEFESAGQITLAGKLEEGDWKAEGAQATVVVAMSQPMIDMSYGAELRRSANAAASKAANTSLRVVLVSGTPATQDSRPARQRSSGGNLRARALEEPVVKRMQEKFGAEIRSIIEPRD